MISEIDQSTLDIDWFFTDGENIAFVASGGGKLPTSIAKSEDHLESLTSYFRALSEKSDVAVDTELSKMNDNIDGHYLSDFIFMSKRGFFCFDKTVLNNFSDTNYHLVTMPLMPLKL